MNVGPDQPTDLSAFDPQTNRLVATWADYDAAGNQIEFKYPGVSNCNRRFADYDANNKMWAYSRPVDIGGSQSPNCPDLGNRSAVAVYQYDGQGNRVSKAEGGVTTTYVYDAFGHLAAEYSSQAPSGGGRFFRTTDHLGSTRLVTDEGANVVARRDFFPFGEQIPASSTYGNRNLVTDGQGNTTYNDGSAFSQQFTAKERDD
ncbi:MAG: hypothetical protein GC160_01745, partial [Acidobacteria bacterium]|nr:hypothetical protein [Acidobacteriota bacterium]